MGGLSASNKGLGERGRPPGVAVAVQCAPWTPSRAAVDESGRVELPRRPGRGDHQRCNGSKSARLTTSGRSGSSRGGSGCRGGGQDLASGVGVVMCNPRREIAVRQLRCEPRLRCWRRFLFKSFQKVRPEILAYVTRR